MHRRLAFCPPVGQYVPGSLKASLFPSCALEGGKELCTKFNRKQCWGVMAVLDNELCLFREGPGSVLLM